MPQRFRGSRRQAFADNLRRKSSRFTRSCFVGSSGRTDKVQRVATSLWNDRRYTAPGKDAADLWMVLRHYGEAGNEDRLYSSEADVLTTYGFDFEEAGAWLLGRDARGVLARGSEPKRLLETLDAILRPEIDPDGALRLVGEMPPGIRDRQLALLAAFHAGLFQEPRPRAG